VRRWAALLRHPWRARQFASHPDPRPAHAAPREGPDSAEAPAGPRHDSERRGRPTRAVATRRSTPRGPPSSGHHRPLKHDIRLRSQRNLLRAAGPAPSRTGAQDAPILPGPTRADGARFRPGRQDAHPGLGRPDLSPRVHELRAAESRSEAEGSSCSRSPASAGAPVWPATAQRGCTNSAQRSPPKGACRAADRRARPSLPDLPPRVHELREAESRSAAEGWSCSRPETRAESLHRGLPSPAIRHGELERPKNEATSTPDAGHADRAWAQPGAPPGFAI
jgi:hypothetical protein